jgi:hypothetical protein
MKHLHHVLGMIVALSVMTFAGIAQTQAASDPTVVMLTQTGCQFVEPEAQGDHGYQTTSGDDCKAINTRTAEERLATAQVIELKPGDYIFRVTNKNVPYELGFYLRGAGLGRLTLPKVSGGGLLEGVTKDYPIHLKEGEYYYSCPLNPTPDYRIVVKQ